jgi:phosphohistidine phosphatase
MATTRRLFLLRHAKSSWDAPDLADRDRPLAPRGRRAAIALAEHLRGLAAPPELVVCSSAARTVETLQLIRSGLPAGVAVTIDAALYGAEAEELLDRVRQLPPTVGAALLIGHNPGIGDLAVMLAGHGDPARRAAMAARFPTAALAELVLTQPWSRFAPRAATLAGYWTPR